MSGPRERARLVEALVAVLLPGDGDFPSGAEAGVQGKLAERLLATSGADGLERVITGLAGLAEAGEAGPDMVRAFERAEPALFGAVRKIAYLTYYESPFVQEAIRALGFAYNAAPLPKGYGVGRFDEATDRPTHGRGRYVKTNEVRRVDLSGLDLEELRHGH
ncbi:MAG: hypothetical protein R3D28_01190 [Geminicoccaceae bacterium]